MLDNGFQRTFNIGELGHFLSTVQDPPVQAIFVAGANPLTQSPDLRTTVEQFSKIKFKVVFDLFLTDTAKMADLVIPAATVFEQDDFFVTSMYSPVLNYSQKAVEPPCGVISEFDFYLKLASKINLNAQDLNKPGFKKNDLKNIDLRKLGFQNSKDYHTKNLQPLLKRIGKKTDLSLETLADEYLRIKDNDIPWQDKIFETPSKKYELYSEKALQDGLSALPCFIEPVQADTDGKFPLRLLTCHTIDSMHSQGFVHIDDMLIVFVNQNIAQTLKLDNKSQVYVKSVNSQIKAILCIDEAIYNNTAFIFEGVGHKNSAVNLLTGSVTSDMGRQAAFYDSFVSIEQIH